MPYQTIKSEYITAIPNLIQMKAKPVVNSQYAQIIFSKPITSHSTQEISTKYIIVCPTLTGLVSTDIASQIYTLADNSSNLTTFEDMEKQLNLSYILKRISYL